MQSKSVIGCLANDRTHSTSTAMVDTEELARGYTLANHTQQDAGIFLLQRLEIARSMRVLDVGCGPGDLTARSE